MKNAFKYLAILYTPIFLIGALIYGFAMIIKIAAAYVMLSPELAEHEIRHLKRSLNL